MRCHVCNATLSETEIVWNPEIGGWEMCKTCLDASLDAAFTDGFSPDTRDDPVEVPFESVDLLDVEYDNG